MTNKTIQINESRADKLALNYLKSKGITDYNKQMEIIGSLKHDIPNLRNGKGKFVLGALRCYFDRQLTDYQAINAFDKALGYIFKGNHQDEYDENLNGVSVEELANKYKDLMKGDLQTDVERSNSRQFQGGSNYKIIPINSFEEAKRYSRYTSWCVTQTEDAFNQYTNKGAKRFYFCLKNDFENIPQQTGENTPLDDYGLSMISVLIDNLDGGSVDRVTTRWNHDHNGENNPELSTAEQLEDVLNVPFYQVFKPYTRDELHRMGFVLFDEVQELLDSGKDPEEIFDYIDVFCEGFVRVQLNDKLNWINTERQLLIPNQWYDLAGNFHEGFARVWLYGKGWNWVNTEGDLLSQDQRYDGVGDFNEGFAWVWLNGKGWNWINTEKRLLSPNQWYNWVGDFHGGFACAKFGNENFYVDKNGIIYDFFTHQPLPDDQQPNLNKAQASRGNLSESNLFKIVDNAIKINNNMNQRKKTVRMNERQLCDLVSEVTRRVLNEVQ